MPATSADDICIFEDIAEYWTGDSTDQDREKEEKMEVRRSRSLLALRLAGWVTKLDAQVSDDADAATSANSLVALQSRNQ